MIKSRADRNRGALALMVMLAFVSAGLLSGCARDGGDHTEPSKLIINGTEVSVPYVATINGNQVSLDEYRYYFLNTKHLADNGDDSYWETKDSDSLQHKLKADALYALEQTYAIEAMAYERNLSLTKDEKSQIESDVKNQITTLGGSAEYKQALSENYLTDELYRFLWETNFYCEKLWTYYFSENGEYYNSDTSLTEDEINQQYSIKFQALLAEEIDQLSVKLASEYELITIDSLF